MEAVFYNLSDWSSDMAFFSGVRGGGGVFYIVGSPVSSAYTFEHALGLFPFHNSSITDFCASFQVSYLTLDKPYLILAV